MTKKKHIGKWIVILAAVIALTAALSGLAMAVNFLGLRDTLLPRPGRVYVEDENGVAVPGEYEYKDFISLSGYNDTPESQALAEWHSFLEDYDPDGAIIAEIGNAPTGFEERYGNYLVYTQDMADKLEEIIARYQLRLHTWLEVILPEVWPLAVGDFLYEDNTAWSGYIYEDGTFHYDGAAELPGYGTIEYQFSRAVRGSFNDVALNIEDLTDFQEWSYPSRSGVTVTLGLGARNRSLIIADLGDSFVLVNVLTGAEGDDLFSSGGIGRAELEALADRFDFAALTPVETPDRDSILAANKRYMEELNSLPPQEPIEGPGSPPPQESIEKPSSLPSEEPADSLYAKTGMTSDIVQDFLHLFSEKLEGDFRDEIANQFVYPALVETADGQFSVSTPEELLEYYDETIGQNRLGLATELAWAPEPVEVFADGSGLASAVDGAIWFGLVEDGAIRIFTMQTDQWSIRPAEGIGQG